MAYAPKNSTLSVRVICAVLFYIFTFLYLFGYQYDILAVAQHELSGGQTHYDRWIGAILITLVLGLLQMGVYALSKLRTYFHALTYLPSLLLLGVITDVGPDIVHGHYIGHWVWGYPLCMVAYTGVVWFGRQFETIHAQEHGPTYLRVLWINLLTMVVASLVTCGIGCTDKVFHYRMRLETALLEQRPGAVSKVGISEQKNDSSLTFLRIWCLSKTSGLGEKLFEYPLTGGSDAMLPNATSVRLLRVPEEKLYKDLGIVFNKKFPAKDYLVRLHAIRRATPLAHDWLLCAYLLDGDLDGFVRTLPRYYDVKKQMPKHYKEALILYTHLRNQPRLVYHDEVMDADFEDYQSLRRQTPDVRRRDVVLRDNYGKTYWFYYYNLTKEGEEK